MSVTASDVDDTSLHNIGCTNTGKSKGHQIKKRKVPSSGRENTAKSKAVKTTILAYCQRSEQGNMTDDSDDVSFDGNEEESREECD